MDRAEVQEWLVALKADTTKAKDALAAIASESESAEDILRHDKGHDDWHASHGDPPCKSEEDCSAMSAKYKNEEATKGIANLNETMAKDIANLKEASMSKLQDAQEWLAAIKADAAKANSIFSKEWEESKHPRGAGGKFGSGSGSGGDAGGSTKTPDRPKLDGQFETGAHDYATNNTILTALNDKATYDKTRDTQTPEETRAAVASASPSNGLSRTDLGATNWGEVHEAVLQSRED